MLLFRHIFKPQNVTSNPKELHRQILKLVLHFVFVELLLRNSKYIKCRLINNENIIAKIELKGKEYLSKIDSNKNVTNNFNNSTIGQFNQESSFSESPISIKTNEIPSKKPETKSRLNKLLSNPWLVGISVAVFTAVLNGKRVMKYINDILDNI